MKFRTYLKGALKKQTEAVLIALRVLEMRKP